MLDGWLDALLAELDELDARFAELKRRIRRPDPGARQTRSADADNAEITPDSTARRHRREAPAEPIERTHMITTAPDPRLAPHRPVLVVVAANPGRAPDGVVMADRAGLTVIPGRRG